MQRDIEAEPFPGVERGHGVNLRGRLGLGAIRLEQRPLEDAIDADVAAIDRQVAGDPRRLEPASELQVGVDRHAAVLVVNDLEVAGRGR